jgi:hypothetical protein
MFFSEEKNHKTFICSTLPNYPAMSRVHPRAPEVKVFWFFSSEKNSLAYFLGNSTANIPSSGNAEHRSNTRKMLV